MYSLGRSTLELEYIRLYILCYEAHSMNLVPANFCYITPSDVPGSIYETTFHCHVSDHNSRPDLYVCKCI